MGSRRQRTDRAGRAVFDLRISQRQHAGHSAHHLCTCRARRLPFFLRRRASAASARRTFPFLSSRCWSGCSRCLAAFAGNATLSAGSRLFLLRRGLRFASGSAAESRKRPQCFSSPAARLMAILGVLICAALLTRIEYNKSLDAAGRGRSRVPELAGGKKSCGKRRPAVETLRETSLRRAAPSPAELSCARCPSGSRPCCHPRGPRDGTESRPQPDWSRRRGPRRGTAVGRPMPFATSL